MPVVRLLSCAGLQSVFNGALRCCQCRVGQQWLCQWGVLLGTPFFPCCPPLCITTDRLVLVLAMHSHSA